ncbi:MAG: hypothetical protein IOB81_17070, partial [Burkholderia sp.]|nr:hypothetical protein [Burkholderia sp.]
MQRMPQMKRTFGGLKPTHAHVTVADDGTGSGLPWADGIIHAMTEVEKRLGQNFHEVSYDYIAMRDQDIGERD